ncbi:NAD(P)-binding protein [Phanerochaete sordida]|uniref:NAD(P)-binding protein n=1 Tax=Phanerochaete sordida TaxID=48140 RepID=A0A9P3LLE3_9APHY|nr:NAD(P)-binding protein [Phanerochaete sordida]
MNYILTGLRENLRPPNPTFSVDHIPDLRGRVCVVTGGYTGIGKEISKALLEHSAKTYVAGRSPSKARAAIQSLKESTGREALFLEVDFSSLASVRRAAQELLACESDIHALYLNAAIMGVPIEQLTTEGYDLHFGTNVIGPWYFTKLLMPALLRGRASSPDQHARVITTSSAGAYMSSLHWDTFTDTPARRKLHPGILYFQSKLGATIVSHELARRYGEQGIVSIAANPGDIKSEIYRNRPAFAQWFTNLMLWPTPMGALCPLFAGTTAEALQYNGEYLAPWGRLARCRDEVYDSEVGRRLWDWLEGQVARHEMSDSESL